MTEEIANTPEPIQAYTRVTARDKRGPGGAFHYYLVEPLVEPPNPLGSVFAQVKFQKGPIADEGVNGCTNEDLLTIVGHRLECFQAGSHPCEENERAIEHVQKALRYLHKRTRERQAQGVEGTGEHRSQ